MAIIGTFTKEAEGFPGNISTLALKAKTTIKPTTKANDQAPDYRVYVAGVEIGAAWSAISKGGKHAREWTSKYGFKRVCARSATRGYMKGSSVISRSMIKRSRQPLASRGSTE